MPTSFDEILLNPYYSAIASGGPEWATAIERSGEGGAVAHRNVNREDFVSRYEIDYANMDRTIKDNLRKFGILRQGMARGFRFLAPDASELVHEAVGTLNESTGEVGYLEETTGTEEKFYFIENFSDPFNAYNRRICKISPYADVLIEIFEPADLNTLLGSCSFAAETFYNVYYQSVPETKSGLITIDGYPPAGRGVTVNFWHGTIQFAPELPAGLTLRVSCQYHLPVAFGEDWQKFSIDEVYTGARKLTVEEILPVELGII